jgi:hypothetical protein
MTRRRAPRGGFLLVEALASMAIGALIIAALAALIGTVLRLGDRTAQGVETLETTGRALSALEGEIRLAARARLAGDGPKAFVFAGAPDRIVFAIDRMQEDGLTRAFAVAWQSAPTDGIVRLLRSEAPLPPGTGSLTAVSFPPAAEIYAGPAGIRFSYFKAQADGSGEVLVDTWTEPGKMPTAVRLALTRISDGALLDTLRVPILADGEPGCAVPGQGFCSHSDRQPGEDDGAPDPMAGEPQPEPNGEGQSQ